MLRLDLQGHNSIQLHGISITVVKWQLQIHWIIENSFNNKLSNPIPIRKACKLTRNPRKVIMLGAIHSGHNVIAKFHHGTNRGSINDFPDAAYLCLLGDWQEANQFCCTRYCPIFITRTIDCQKEKGFQKMISFLLKTRTKSQKPKPL